MGMIMQNGKVYSPIPIVFDEYLHFNDECIDTPIALNANYRVFCDFQYDSFQTQVQLIGNTAGNTTNFYAGGLWNGSGQNKIYVKTISGEQSTILSDYTVRHTIDVNNGGKIYIDNTYWVDGAPNTNSNIYFTIGYRGSDSNLHRFIGKIYRLFIYDNSNEQYLLDLRPAHFGNTYGMYDIINRKFYTKQPR